MCRRREKELGLSASGHVSHLWLVPRACALGPLGSRVGPPWPLKWALPQIHRQRGLQKWSGLTSIMEFCFGCQTLGYSYPGCHVCPHSRLVHCVCVQWEDRGLRGIWAAHSVPQHCICMTCVSPRVRQMGSRQVLSAPVGETILWTAVPLGWIGYSRAGLSRRG